MKNSVLLVLASFGFASLAVAAEAPPTEVVQIDHVKVEAAFAHGGPALLANSAYKVMAGHRVEPGNVEFHTNDTDIFYIVAGSATFVTGGTVADLKSTGPGESRGTSITGGTTHHLTTGDVIVIPKGTPHQFTAVEAPFRYFVVKVTE